MTTNSRKVKCPKCSKMNEKSDAVLIGKRYFCKECVEEKKETEPIKEKEIRKREIKRFEMHEEVPVISLVKRGNLIFEDHEGVIYEWQDFKDENWMTIKSLVHMRNRHKMFFSEPWVRVDDEVAEFLKIKVDDTIDIENIDAFFNLDNDEFEEKLISASNGVRNIVVDTALIKIETGELDSRQKIRIIESVCKVELDEKDYREFVEEVK